MLSLLIMSGVRGDPRRYRTFHLYEQACLAGLNCQLSHVTDDKLQNKAQSADIVILHRAYFTDQIAWLEKEAHRKGGLLIQDIDDLVFEPDVFQYINSPDFADPNRSSLYQEEMRMYRKTMELCDAVTTSTGFLAERIRQLGNPVWVHRNAFSLEMLDRSEKAHKSKKGMDERVVIGYASGTATHNQDFAQIKPALITILRNFPNVELWLVGPLDPGKAWGSMGDRVHKFKKVPWRNLPEIQAQFDINLAPVRTDNPFGESKSEIKYVESALVRVPTVASPSDAFKVAIRHADNGFLATSTKEWEYILEELICEPGLRRKVGEAAFEDVIQRYHPLVRAKQLVETLSAMIGQVINLPVKNLDEDIDKLGSTQSYWSSAQAEKSPSLYQMGRYTLRNRGFNVLLKQIRVYFRRLVAPIVPYRRIS